MGSVFCCSAAVFATCLCLLHWFLQEPTFERYTKILRFSNSAGWQDALHWLLNMWIDVSLVQAYRCWDTRALSRSTLCSPCRAALQRSLEYTQEMVKCGNEDLLLVRTWWNKVYLVLSFERTNNGYDAKQFVGTQMNYKLIAQLLHYIPFHVWRFCTRLFLFRGCLIKYGKVWSVVRTMEVMISSIPSSSPLALSIDQQVSLDTTKMTKW